MTAWDTSPTRIHSVLPEILAEKMRAETYLVNMHELCFGTSI